MKKPQPGRVRSFKAQPGSSNRGDELPSAAGRIIESVDVAAIPIDDPFLEKSLADKDHDTLLYYLSRNTGYGKISAHALRSRIIEIYRRCYEECSTRPEAIIRDFVAAYPQLVFEAEWLRGLIETQASNRDFRPTGPRNRLFREMANGFRRASNPKGRITRAMRNTRMDAARFALPDIRKDLDEWDKTLERTTATSEWIVQRATAKATELVAHPRLESHRQQLKELLCRGQLYKVSILVAATIYCVRPRDLESKQS